MFLFESINSYHSQLSNGSTTCLAAVEHYLARIADNKHLNAFVRTYDDEARENAKILDKKRGEGDGHVMDIEFFNFDRVDGVISPHVLKVTNHRLGDHCCGRNNSIR